MMIIVVVLITASVLVNTDGRSGNSSSSSVFDMIHKDFELN